MKKYFLLIFCVLLSLVCVINIPNISNEFAKECAVISIVNSTAVESVFCKGVVEEEDGSFVVRVQISEDDISKIGIGDVVKVSCKALGDVILQGKVKALSDFAYKIVYGGVNITVVDGIIELNDLCDGLKSGYSATVEIIYTKLENATIIPFEGVAQENNGKYYVYRVDDNWAIKEYVNIAFEDEKGAVVFGECSFRAICEEPESFSGDFVRIKNAWDD